VSALFAGKAKLPEVLPEHIAVIMDGNGRWAKRRALPRRAGHRAGSETFRKIAIFCRDIGIKYLTVYAFSTENRTRPADETRHIFGLLGEYLSEALESMARDRVRLRFFGDTSILPPDTLAKIAAAEALSESIDGAQVNLCVNYGARAEIIRAARALRDSGEAITERSFARCLYTSGIPDPDILIRPGGETRLSNFLLWQAAYSELYFTKTLWPDFTAAELTRILRDYAGRTRRFGGLAEAAQ
jgi:undecaprenyl diphosphate synthase